MKTELSAYELGILAKELQITIGAKIDNIYQNKDEFYIQFHKSNVGKLIFRIVLPSMCFITSLKENIPEKPSGFCMNLRKQLLNSKLNSLIQHDFERILELDFLAKDKKLKLIVELFSTGNLILLDDKKVIILSYRTQIWSSRKIKVGEEYLFPPSKADLFEINSNEFKELIIKSSRDSIVKTLAIDLGIGGVYAEEILKRAELSKTLLPSKLSANELLSIYKEIQNLKMEESLPRVYSKEGLIVDVVPIKMRIYEGIESKPYSSFNEALDSFFSKAEFGPKEKGKTRIEKLKTIIEEQEKNIQKFEAEMWGETRKGELAYENYALIKELLEKIKELRKTNDWREIKKKIMLKYPQIEEINEKKGEIVLKINNKS